MGPGIDTHHPAMRLWRLAKEHGTWDPAALELSQDAEDWARLGSDEQRFLRRLASVFLAGEESVTREILPTIRVIEAEDRLEEEIFLTSFLWEEAKHVEFFWRFFEEVAPAAGGPAKRYSKAYERIFLDELPRRMRALDEDPTPATQARAGVTYHMVVEGILAQTGYHAYGAILEERGLMPGMQAGIEQVQRDEARHLAYGTFLLSRLVAEHGAEAWQAIEDQMDLLLEPAMGVVEAAFQPYEQMPFDLEPDAFLTYAAEQHTSRYEKLERARDLTVDEVHERFGGAQVPGPGEDAS